jgi:hypothetical protein
MTHTRETSCFSIVKLNPPFLSLLVLSSEIDCGHTIQVPNRHNTEEDGLDECRSRQGGARQLLLTLRLPGLVPLDGEDRMITDNVSSIPSLSHRPVQ